MAVTAAFAQRLRQVTGGLEGEAPSPCVSICRMDAASGLCEGCFRTLDEIAAWAALDEDAKREVWQRLGRRAAAGTQELER